MKRPKHKRFEYLPRYYDPEKDPETKRRRRIELSTKVRRGKRPTMARLILWLAAALVTYFLITG